MDDEHPASFEPAGRPAGRPRNDAIDARVLGAVRDLLVEAGWEGTSIRGVAARSGVSRAAITRRWPSKVSLVLAAVMGPAEALRPAPGLAPDAWVRAVVRGTAEVFARPEVRAALPALLATLRDEDDVRAALWASFGAPALASAPTGADRPDPTDQTDPTDATAVLVLASGAAIALSLIVPEADTPALRRRIAALLSAAPT